MTSPAHRAVFDCVVFAQALINPRGPAGECVGQAFGGRVVLFVSHYVLDEIRDLPAKIPAKHGVTLEPAEKLIGDIVAFATIINTVPAVYAHPHDPDDSHYVNLALHRLEAHHQPRPTPAEPDGSAAGRSTGVPPAFPAPRSPAARCLRASAPRRGRERIDPVTACPPSLFFSVTFSSGRTLPS